MNYSLVGANCTTHCKIVAVAIVTTTLLGFGIHAIDQGHANQPASSISKPQTTDGRTYAGADNFTVCRFSTL